MASRHPPLGRPTTPHTLLVVFVVLSGSPAARAQPVIKETQHGLENTFQSHLIRLDIPGLAGGRLRLLWELRSKLVAFSVLRQHFNLGAIAFLDAGRVWSDFDAPARLDGTGVGLKVGAGGGLRLQWGEAFLLRMDIAWSPDAAPVAFYFNVNHVF